jgi:hypothetical protein
VPPFLARYTIDTHHTPAYAVGYLADKIKPRMLMTTHMTFDLWLNEETVAEVWHHWDGPYHFGAPVEALPENLRKSMGGHWEYSQGNCKKLEEMDQ